VYCCYRIKNDILLHQVSAAMQVMLLPFVEVSFGKNVDADLRPDWTWYINGVSIHGELDRGTEGYRQARDRMHEYTKRRDFVLWVAPTQVRLDGLRERAKCIRSHALFKLADSETITDYAGHTIHLAEISDLLQGQGA